MGKCGGCDDKPVELDADGNPVKRKRRRLIKCSLRGDPTYSFDCGCSGIYQIYKCGESGGHCVQVPHDKPKGKIVETGERVYTVTIPVCGQSCKHYVPEVPVES